MWFYRVKVAGTSVFSRIVCGPLPRTGFFANFSIAALLMHHVLSVLIVRRRYFNP